MNFPGHESVRRLKVASSLLLFVAAVVVAAVANGCMPSGSTTGPDANPTAAASPTTSPTATPTTAPTTVPTTVPTTLPTTTPTFSPTSGPVIVPDGVYGPGVFTRGADCVPPFFGPTYSGTLTITGNGTVAQIGESQTRLSSGTYNSTTHASILTGTGVVGTTPATWTVDIIFSSTTANVTETIRLMNINCVVNYVSPTLLKR